MLKSNKLSYFNEFNGFYLETDNDNDTVIKNQFLGQKIGVFTSGGDSCGMNAALESIIRMGAFTGCKIYLIHEGFQGMIEGGNNFELAGSKSIVSDIIGIGGTVIGSSRCSEFMERSGRLKAAKNLVKNGIHNLICIGGDGTLTGADILKKEWKSLLDDLLYQNHITSRELNENSHLSIVGLVGTIDNDFYGTDMTIGANTALHRIVEAIDTITTTALSHQRCFIMEVMGRHCGYLALNAGLACEADWIFIPEQPPKENWEEDLCKRITYHREAGHRLNIIIVSEGAVDSMGNPIKSQYIKKLISDKLKIDTKITVLGYVQRGGKASFFDRLLGARMGSEALISLMLLKPKFEPIVIGIHGNQTCYLPLKDAVEKTRIINDAMNEKNFELAFQLRSPSFFKNLERYIKMSKCDFDPTKITHKNRKYNLAILTMGAPSCGINSIIRSFVRQGIIKGCKIFGIQDGFEGLKKSLIKELDWKSVYGWTSLGGSILGSQRIDAAQVGFDKIAEKIKQFEIDGLLLIGGFDAFNSTLQMYEQRKNYNEFCLPIIYVPATISNNIPGTDLTIGSDTALNEIVTICDKIKQSAMGSKKRVFLVETMGGYCGYLATAAGLASGSDQSYIFEEKFTINDLIDDVNHLKNKMTDDSINFKRGLIIRNEKANENFTSQFILSLLNEESEGFFSSRMNILGHMQQGGSPSPFDRVLGVKFGGKTLDCMVELLDKSAENDDLLKNKESALLIGIQGNQVVLTPIIELKEKTDFKHRIPLNQWWMNLRPLGRILGHHEARYTSEVLKKNICELRCNEKISEETSCH